MLFSISNLNFRTQLKQQSLGRILFLPPVVWLPFRGSQPREFNEPCAVLVMMMIPVPLSARPNHVDVDINTLTISLLRWLYNFPLSIHGGSWRFSGGSSR